MKVSISHTQLKSTHFKAKTGEEQALWAQIQHYVNNNHGLNKHLLSVYTVIYVH